MPNSQLNKLKSGIRNNTKLALKLLPNIADDSNDENDFLQKLLLIITLVSKLRKAFTNNFSANVKLSKKSNA